MLTVCYINRLSGRGYHYSETNAWGESAASKKCCLVTIMRYAIVLSAFFTTINPGDMGPLDILRKV